MTSQVDAYRARAAEYERKAEPMGKRNAAIREYYQRLAQHYCIPPRQNAEAITFDFVDSARSRSRNDIGAA